MRWRIYKFAYTNKLFYSAYHILFRHIIDKDEIYVLGKILDERFYLTTLTNYID